MPSDPGGCVKAKLMTDLSMSLTFIPLSPLVHGLVHQLYTRMEGIDGLQWEKEVGPQAAWNSKCMLDSVFRVGQGKVARGSLRMGFRGSRVQISASRPNFPRIFKDLARLPLA